MNRRGFLGSVLGASALAGLETADRPVLLAESHVRTVRPPAPRRPSGYDFERVLPTDCDVCASAVVSVLARMGWDNEATERPLLVAHTEMLLSVREVADVLGCDYYVTTKLTDTWAWFIEWSGRRAGSVGA
jgi:hypothetical protein